MKVGSVAIQQGVNGLEICLVSSSKNPDRYTVPKGGVHKKEKPLKAALRELEEEAGIRGRILPTLPPFLVKDPHTEEDDCLYFFVKVKKIHISWIESYFRKRIWVPLNQLNQIALKSKAKAVSEHLQTIENFEELFQEAVSQSKEERSAAKKLLKEQLKQGDFSIWLTVT